MTEKITPLNLISKIKNAKEQNKLSNKGIGRAYLAQNAVCAAALVPGVLLPSLINKNVKLSIEDSISISNAAQNALETSGLKAKGVEIFTLETADIKVIKEKLKAFLKAMFSSNNTENSPDAILQTGKELLKSVNYADSDKPAVDAMKNAILKNEEIKKGVDSLAQLGIDMTPVFDTTAKIGLLDFKLGRNGAFIKSENKIIVPDNVMKTSVFHEMGHALNKNSGAVLRTLQKHALLVQQIVPYVALIAIMNKKTLNQIDKKDETKESKKDGIIQKTMDFVKKHACLITFLSFLPQITEEGLASLRGGKLAYEAMKKGEISKQILSKINKINIASFSSYMLSGIITALSIKAAIKVKDKIQEKYELKKNNSVNKKALN